MTFNVARAHPTSSTATTIATSVPPGTGSGRLTVATPAGTATSAADFFIPPTPYTAADVDFTGRVAVGGSIVVSIPTVNHIGLVVFDGVAGQRMGLESRASTIANVDLKLYSPAGALLQTRAAGLQVTAATAPPAIDRTNSGTYQFPASWTVQNAGTASAYPLFVFNNYNWQDRVYLSTDAIFDAADVQILSQPRSTPLAAGASYTASATAVSPSTAPGSYYVLFVTDPSGFIPESNDTNNVRAVGPITLLGPPDLVPTAFTGPASVPRANNGTYSIAVSWTITNQGPSAAGPSMWDYVYLSTDATWDASDTYLGGVYTSTALAAGASYTKNQTYTTSAVPPGTYYMIVRADATSYVTEGNEGNNTRVLGPLTFLAGPDLVPTDFTGPASVPRSVTGSYSIPVSWMITNQGPSATAAGTYDYVYLSTDAVLDASDTLLASVYTPTTLAAGASYTKTQTVSTSRPPGAYYLIVLADGGAFVTESNETNNTRVLPVTFLGPPDLTPTAVTGPTSPVPRNANGTYTFAASWTVTNQGESPTGTTWTDRLFISTDAVYGGDTQLTTATRSTVLAAGASYTETRPSITTGVMSAGTYYLIVRTDADSALPEVDDANNTLVHGPFTLSP